MGNIKGYKKLTYEESHKIDENGELFKLCNICNEWFPCVEEYFYKTKNKTDNLQPYCKKCSKEKQIKYQEENKETQSKRHKKWREGKSEVLNNRTKEWIKNNSDEWSKYMHDYQQNNRDKMKKYRLNRDQHKKHTINKKEWELCKEYFRNCCAYCGLPVEEHFYKYGGEIKQGDLHKEHVDHEGANDLSNCVPSCKSCNSQKWKSSLEDWYNKNNKYFTQERLDKINKWLNEDYKLYIINKNKNPA